MEPPPEEASADALGIAQSKVKAHDQKHASPSNSENEAATGASERASSIIDDGEGSHNDDGTVKG